MVSLEALKQLRDDSVRLNMNLKEITDLLDEQGQNLEGMQDISSRIKKAFELYRSLVHEMKDNL